MDEKAALLDKQAQLQSQLQQMGDALRATAVSNEVNICSSVLMQLYI